MVIALACFHGQQYVVVTGMIQSYATNFYFHRDPHSHRSKQHFYLQIILQSIRRHGRLPIPRLSYLRRPLPTLAAAGVAHRKSGEQRGGGGEASSSPPPFPPLLTLPSFPSSLLAAAPRAWLAARSSSEMAGSAWGKVGSACVDAGSALFRA